MSGELITPPPTGDDEPSDPGPGNLRELGRRFEKLPPELLKHLKIQIHESMSGPLPPPKILQGYKEVGEFVLEHILSSADKALDSTIEDRKTARSIERRGQVFALVVAVSGLAVAAFATYLHERTIACFIGGADLVALVAVFLGSSKNNSK